VRRQKSLGDHWLDDKGWSFTPLSTTVTAAACGWTPMAVGGRLAAEPGKPIKRVRLVVIADGFQANEELHVDDVALYRME